MHGDVRNAMRRVVKQETEAADTVIRKRELPERRLAERLDSYGDVARAWLRGRARDRFSPMATGLGLKNPQLTGSNDTPEGDEGQVAMADKENVRQQFREAFEGADYPVNSPMDLVPALPNGPGTTFEIGDETITAMELNQEASGQADYPYDSVDELVDALIDGMEDQDYF
jgi:hypothetical protein